MHAEDYSGGGEGGRGRESGRGWESGRKRTHMKANARVCERCKRTVAHGWPGTI